MATIKKKYLIFFARVLEKKYMIPGREFIPWQQLIFFFLNV
jgi:hypothetical protein